MPGVSLQSKPMSWTRLGPDVGFFLIRGRVIRRFRSMTELDERHGRGFARTNRCQLRHAIAAKQYTKMVR